MTGPRIAPPDIDGLRFEKWIGGGGFADVFRYVEVSLDRPVAVKVLHGVGGAALQSFRTEASVMAKLSGHTSIVTILRTDVAKDRRPYLVMQLCPGSHLGTRIARAPLAVPQALEVVIQIAGAVEAAHRLGILHRDIKPANILFGQSGRPLLTDFGISVAAGGAVSAKTALSPIWAPPEQFGSTGEPVGPHSDVYSLAATLWAMLVGRSPAELPGGPNDRHAVQQRVRTQPCPRTNREDVPDSLERVLASAMAKRPAERYASALEFARALQVVQSELHLSRTDVELLDDQLDDDSLPAMGTGTVVSNLLLIQPDLPAGQSRTAGSDTRTSEFSDLGFTSTATTPQGDPVLRHGTGFAAPIDPLEFTVAPAVDPVQPPAPELPKPGPTAEKRPRRVGRTVAWVAAGATVVAVLVTALVVGLTSLGAGSQTSRPSPSAVVVPRDPVGVAVPAVVDLTVVRRNGKVTATWRNPSPEPGDSFLYEVKDPSKPVELQVSAKNRVSVSPLPGQTCIGVRLLRATGTESPETTGCAR